MVFPPSAPAEWTAFGTMITAVVAVIAALFTGWQVWELRRTRQEQARPFVVVDVQPSRTSHLILNLIVENVGTTLARDVRIEFDPPVQTSDDDRQEYRLSESALLTEGLPSLPPGRRIEALFDTGPDRLKAGLPLRYDVTVRSKDARGRQLAPLQYVIDLRPLYGLLHTTQYGSHHIAKSLREIEKLLRQSRNKGRLTVWTRSEDLDRAQDQATVALTGHPRALGRTPPPDWLVSLLASRPMLRPVAATLASAWRRVIDVGGPIRRRARVGKYRSE